MDIVAAIVPFVPAGGTLAVKAVKKADDVVDAVKAMKQGDKYPAKSATS